MYKVVFFGTPDFVIPIAQALKDKGWLTGIVTTPITDHSPVAAFAQKENIPILKTEDLKDIDLIVLAAYGKLLPPSLLNIPKYGSLNIHPSLLPRYRGPSPIQQAILNGDKVSGVTIIKMDQKMDHGPVVTTSEIRLSEQDTSETLSTKMFEEGVDLLIKIIPQYIAGKVTLTPQNDKDATFTHLIKKEDGYFDINNPPSFEKLNKMIRAYYPWPTAWTLFRQGSRGQARIVKFLPGGLVQMEGKKAVPLEDFLRGHPDFPDFFLRQ